MLTSASLYYKNDDLLESEYILRNTLHVNITLPGAYLVYKSTFWRKVGVQLVCDLLSRNREQVARQMFLLL